MSNYENDTRRRLFRDPDRAMVAGVCSGIADYFGFNVRVTRLLAVIALLMAFPMTVLAYIAAVVLIPSRSSAVDRPRDARFRQAVRSSPAQTASDVRRRFQSLDRRLARIEKYVTSSRYQLDREFRQL